MREKARERITALVLFVILAFYSLTIGWRGFLLIADGRLVPVVMGVAVILIPLVALIAIWRLVVFARDGSAMMARQADPALADEPWRAHLAEAERYRQAGERALEQRAYRAAVRAWRESRSA